MCQALSPNPKSEVLKQRFGHPKFEVLKKRFGLWLTIKSKWATHHSLTLTSNPKSKVLKPKDLEFFGL